MHFRKGGMGIKPMPKMMTNKFRNIIFTLSMRRLSMHWGRKVDLLSSLG